MTPMMAHLARRIRTDGPITIADYMATCLLHPQYGYYMTADPLGRDFTTAPEISQMFGELVGLSLAQAWLDQGSPSPFNLVEVGPGRGTLMADALRAADAVPGFLDAADLHLVEASPTLRARQKESIQHSITHHDSLSDVPDGPLFLIANEFFDALPIRQFIRDGDGWRERQVTLDDERLTFALAPRAQLAHLEARLDDTKDGDLVEICPAAEALAGEIGMRILNNGGAALIVDYGSDGSLGDTFQAIRDGRKAAPLEAPGDADLTAHVDFAALRRAAAPASVSKTIPQGVFLERLGITQRAQALARGAHAEAVIGAHRRLTHPEEMGSLFKVIAITAPDTPFPPGLE